MAGSKICAEYIIKNEFNELYVTEAQMHSAIEQTAEGINMEVSKKVGENEIISKINQSAEKILISGDKIDINGKAVNFSTEINETFGPFTIEDYNRVKGIIEKTISATSSDYEKYDINKDGVINILDGADIVYAINHGGYYIKKGTFKINPYSSTEAIKITDEISKRTLARLSLFEMFFNHILTYGLETPINDIGVSANYTSMIDIAEENGQGGIRAQIYKDDNNEFTSNLQMHSTMSNLLDIIVREGECSARFQVGANTETIVSANGITTPVLSQTSKRESKKNISKLKNALDIIKNVDIYKYNLKKEKKGTKKHIGFVIGDSYNYSEELTNNTNDGAEIYSLASVCLAGIKEQQEIIEGQAETIKELTERIEKLEAKANG